MNENEEQSNGLNWYQALAVISLLAYSIAIIVIATNIGDSFTFLTFFLLALIGIISFAFIYGIGTIISLLTEINDKLTLNSKINNPNNKTTQNNRVYKVDKNKGNEEIELKEDEIPWELKE